MEERLQFVRDALSDRFTMSARCARYGVSRRIGYKWLARYDDEGRRGLVDRGLVQKRRHRRPPVHPGVVRPTTVAPNDLWTADFKGQFRTGDGRYCYPLTIADQHPRFLLACRGLRRKP